VATSTCLPAIRKIYYQLISKITCLIYFFSFSTGLFLLKNIIVLSAPYHGVCGTEVIAIVPMISFTLRMLMPYSSQNIEKIRYFPSLLPIDFTA